jgi:hypothetical protein
MGTSMILLMLAFGEIDLSQSSSCAKQRIFAPEIYGPKMPRFLKKRLRFVRDLTVEG